jgi:hypothetical protein
MGCTAPTFHRDMASAMPEARRHAETQELMRPRSDSVDPARERRA